MPGDDGAGFGRMARARRALGRGRLAVTRKGGVWQAQRLRVAKKVELAQHSIVSPVPTPEQTVSRCRPDFLLAQLQSDTFVATQRSVAHP